MRFELLTVVFVAATVLSSISGFGDERVVNKLILWPWKMRDKPGQLYRLLTNGFVHADWTHLLFNMFTLYFMGTFVERLFVMRDAWLLYAALYLGGIVVSALPSFVKHQKSPYYRSLGASGGVAAVLFSSVYFSPWSSLYVFFFRMPSIVFGVLYLVYSAVMSRRGGGYVNHDAHFWGAVYGFLFTLATDPDHGRLFFEDLTSPRF